jgi:hypothetical protein
MVVDTVTGLFIRDVTFFSFQSRQADGNLMSPFTRSFCAGTNAGIANVIHELVTLGQLGVSACAVESVAQKSRTRGESGLRGALRVDLNPKWS